MYSSSNNLPFEQCYVCGLPATSREHVPPLCLFPERKDLKGADFRTNLITVPSCDLHNAKKSTDDEFLMVSIAALIQNNPLGYFHSITKVDRAIRRKSADFLRKSIMRNPKNVDLPISQSVSLQAVEGNPDFQRLLRCFRSIAAGLFYHKYKFQFKGRIHVHMGFIRFEDTNMNTFVSFLRRRFELEELRLDVEGYNPAVFKYQFCSPDNLGIIALKIIFYEGTEVFIAFQPSEVVLPLNLVDRMIKDGVPTVITLGEEKFHFNNSKDVE